jgi:hypothetical protein
LLQLLLLALLLALPPSHTGTVNATCTVAAPNATFANPGLANTVTSTPTSVATVCNSTTSKLDLALDAHVAADAPAGASVSGLTRTYNVSTGTGAYSGVTAATGVTVTTTVSDLSNAFSSTASTLPVTTTLTADSGKNLPAGNYTTRIIATVTP